MRLTVKSSPHHRQARSTAAIMRRVGYAMIPGIITQMYFFGWGVLIQLLLASVTAVVVEGLFLRLRERDWRLPLQDCSALLTAWLLAVCLPPLLPWWMTVLGVVFAIAIAKQLYGGLGFNLFNPAMVGYVVLLISFPVQMSAWLPPVHIIAYGISFADTLSLIFTATDLTGYDVQAMRLTVDGISAATPLDALRTSLANGYTLAEFQQNTFNDMRLAAFPSAAAVVNLAYLLGGLILLQQRIIQWHIPLSMLLGMTAVASCFYLFDADRFASPLCHLLHGGAMLGAFFIATDPVSGSTTPRGRLWFGAMIGAWVVIIRTFGNYPDAVAFAVLIMNIAVPLIDYYTQPKVYGRSAPGEKNP